ncbi:anti-repressor SinI family protein [Cytobacillus praedii]|nr:anti-repressor SinI family protein [Cytobacillus praedii]
MKSLLDKEWVTLILEAKRLGLSIEEVKDFLLRNLKATS